jgi:hypothetical protein
MTDEVPKFGCNHWDRVFSTGWIAHVNCDKDRPRDGESLKGPVIINGKRYICTGVERIEMSEPMRKGESIGLLIEGQI